MIKGRESFLAKISIGIQVTLSVGCYALAEHWFPNSFSINQNIFFLVQLVILIGFLLNKLKLGNVFRSHAFHKTLRNYFIVISLGSILLLSEFVILKGFYFKDYIFISVYSVANLIALLLFRILFYKGMLQLRKKGFNSRQILIIAEEESVDFIQEMISSKDWGYRIWGIIDDSHTLSIRFPELHFVDPATSLKDLIDSEAIDEILYCRSILHQHEIDHIREICSEVGVVFHLHTNLEVELNQVKSTGQRQFITYQTTPSGYIHLKMKSLFDFYFSLFVLIFFSPTFLIIGLIIKLEDGGPVFFKQERVGLNGRRFYCYKFRTMVANAEALKSQLAGMNEQDGPVFKIQNDPRVTKIGKFLRETSIDELPQFFNVLKGEMSVVGPRPPVPSEVEQYQRWQLRRLSMKPGITCTWQVSGRNAIKFDEWMKMDMQYIDSWSLRQDFKLIFKTVTVIFNRTGH